MALPIMMGLRVAQGVMAVLILGLSAYVANWYNMDTLTASPSQINFLIVSPLVSLFTIAYLEVVPKFAPRASHPAAAPILEIFNSLFYFAGFIALAVFLTQLLFCRGSVCAAARADNAIAAFAWVAWTASAVLSTREYIKNNGIAIRRRGNVQQMKESQMA